MDHTYRHSRYGFKKNTIESEEAPVRLIGQQIWDKVRQFAKSTEVRKSVRLPSNEVEHSWTKQSIFWETTPLEGSLSSSLFRCDAC